MTYLLIAVAVAMLGCGALYVSGQGLIRDISDVRQLASRSRTVNIEAFRRLHDSSDMQFLQTRLRGAELRRLQRLRSRAELEYLTAIFHNAAILIRIGDLARQTSREDLSAAGERLIRAAVQVRWLAAMAMSRQVLGYIWPSNSLASHTIADHYELLRDRLAAVALIECPADSSRVCAAL